MLNITYTYPTSISSTEIISFIINGQFIAPAIIFVMLHALTGSGVAFLNYIIYSTYFKVKMHKNVLPFSLFVAQENKWFNFVETKVQKGENYNFFLHIYNQIVDKDYNITNYISDLISILLLLTIDLCLTDSVFWFKALASIFCIVLIIAYTGGLFLFTAVEKHIDYFTDIVETIKVYDSDSVGKTTAFIPIDSPNESTDT